MVDHNKTFKESNDMATIKSIKKDLLKHEKIVRKKIKVIEKYLVELTDYLDKMNISGMTTQKNMLSADPLKSGSSWVSTSAFDNIQENMRNLQNILKRAQKQFAVHLEHTSGMPGTLCNYLGNRNNCAKITNNFTKATCPECRKIVEDNKKFLEGYGLKVE